VLDLERVIAADGEPRQGGHPQVVRLDEPHDDMALRAPAFATDVDPAVASPLRELGNISARSVAPGLASRKVTFLTDDAPQ
jgi:hypothetical protein